LSTRFYHAVLSERGFPDHDKWEVHDGIYFSALVCQQYLVRTATNEYQIRQPKPSEQAILPANTPIEFTLDKDKMKFKLNGKKYEFLIVGTSAIQAQ